MEIIVKEIREHYTYARDKRQIIKKTIVGETLEECFKTLYSFERGARYNNHLYYNFFDEDLEKQYLEWRKNNVTIEMYYGGGVVD